MSSQDTTACPQAVEPVYSREGNQLPPRNSRASSRGPQSTQTSQGVASSHGLEANQLPRRESRTASYGRGGTQALQGTGSTNSREVNQQPYRRSIFSPEYLATVPGLLILGPADEHEGNQLPRHESRVTTHDRGNTQGCQTVGPTNGHGSNQVSRNNSNSRASGHSRESAQLFQNSGSANGQEINQIPHQYSGSASGHSRGSAQVFQDVRSANVHEVKQLPRRDSRVATHSYGSNQAVHGVGTTNGQEMNQLPRRHSRRISGYGRDSTQAPQSTAGGQDQEVNQLPQRHAISSVYGNNSNRTTFATGHNDNRDSQQASYAAGSGIKRNSTKNHARRSVRFPEGHEVTQVSYIHDFDSPNSHDNEQEYHRQEIESRQSLHGDRVRERQETVSSNYRSGGHERQYQDFSHIHDSDDNIYEVAVAPSCDTQHASRHQSPENTNSRANSQAYRLHTENSASEVIEDQAPHLDQAASLVNSKPPQALRDSFLCKGLRIHIPPSIRRTQSLENFIAHHEDLEGQAAAKMTTGTYSTSYFIFSQKLRSNPVHVHRHSAGVPLREYCTKSIWQRLDERKKAKAKAKAEAEAAENRESASRPASHFSVSSADTVATAPEADEKKSGILRKMLDRIQSLVQG